MPKIKNKREEEYCQQYVVDFNGARSARDAGYGKAGARVMASKLMIRAHIYNRIAELLKNRSERTQITQDMVIQELATIGFSDFTDFAKYTKAKGLVIEETDKVNLKRSGASRAILSMKQVDNQGGRSVSIRLHGKCEPLKLLGKHVGMFADTHNVNLTGTIKVVSAVPRPKKKKEKEE